LKHYEFVFLKSPIVFTSLKIVSHWPAHRSFH
jgi:hypothetical protein